MCERLLTSKDSASRSNRTRGPKQGADQRPPERKRLADSDGPDPNTPPEAVTFSVGQVVGSHGLEGTLKVRIFSDDPEHLLSVDAFTLGNEPRPRPVLSSQLHAGQLLITLEGISTPEDALRFSNVPVRLPAEMLRPLAPDEFFIYQILGLAVRTEEGNLLGSVTDLIETGANDVLVVSPDDGGPDLLLPMIADVIVKVDPTGGTIVARTLQYYGEA